MLADRRGFHDAGTATYGIWTTSTLLPRDLRQKRAFAWATAGLLVARTDRNPFPPEKTLQKKEKNKEMHTI